MKQKYKLLMTVLAGIFLIYGCSPSSNTLRYKGRYTTQTEADSNVRFTSDESSNKSDIYSQNTDTSTINEMSDDSDSDEFPDETPIDISSIMQKISNQKSTQNTAISNTTKEQLLMEIIKYLNTPYLYGGTTMNGIDCSAFTQAVFQNTFQTSLLRSARDQYTQGFEIDDRQDLQFGDLVFFNTRRRVRPGHVGIYIGDNLFAHSSSKNGVIVSSLDHEYYSRKFMGGRRIEGLLNSKL